MSSPVEDPQATSIYVGYGTPRAGLPIDWILILVPYGVYEAGQDKRMSTWFQIKGGPSEGKEYELDIQEKEFMSPEVISRGNVNRIPTLSKEKVFAAAQQVPPQMSQHWVTAVLGVLAEMGLVPEWIVDTYRNQMQPLDEPVTENVENRDELMEDAELVSDDLKEGYELVEKASN